MRVFLVFIFILLCYGIDFVKNETILEVEQKYGFFAKRRFEALQKLILKLQNETDTKKLEEVNNFFNGISYSTDKDIYGVADYWATPFEFLARGEGDCEDYAIAKYFLLKYLGIDSKKLFLTYVTVIEYNASHMVLTYFETPNSEPLVLDSIKDDILKASKRTDLKPIYYFNPDILKDGPTTTAHRKWDQLMKNITENKL